MLKKHKKLVLLVLVVLIGALLFYFKDYLSLFYTAAAPESAKAVQQDKDFNVLLMGIGGGNHDGPNLTDTIILANIRPSKNQVNLISIPRDLWVPDLQAKINEAYSDGQDQGKGILMARATMEKVTGAQIDYVVVLDFDGFSKLVDDLGGIDVNVVRTFDDYAYPIAGKEDDLCGHTSEEVPLIATSEAELDAFPCRYEHLHFDKGETHMNGTTALKYVRSRHALGVEGTDFARSARQELAIKAIREKALSLNILFNPVKVLSIYNILKGNINTDIPVSNYGDFIKIAKRMQDVKIKSYVIGQPDSDAGTYGLLTNPVPSADYNFAWVLAPRVGNGNFSEIHDYVKCVTSVGSCTVTADGVVPTSQLKSATESAALHQSDK
jgi:LCP family protein required for cell wall assembly